MLTKFKSTGMAPSAGTYLAAQELLHSTQYNHEGEPGGNVHNEVVDVKCPSQCNPGAPSNDSEPSCPSKPWNLSQKSRSRRLRSPLCRCYSSGSDLSQYLTLNLTVAVAQRPCSGDRTRGGRVFMLSFFFFFALPFLPAGLFHQHRPVYSLSLAAVLSRILAVLLTCFSFALFSTFSQHPLCLQPQLHRLPFARVTTFGRFAVRAFILRSLGEQPLLGWPNRSLQDLWISDRPCPCHQRRTARYLPSVCCLLLFLALHSQLFVGLSA